MKNVLKMLAVAAVISWVVPMFAADAPPTRTRGLMGKIVSVDGAKVTIAVRERGADATAEPKKVEVTTDDKTAVTIDGKEAKVADLQKDMTAMVTPAEGTATRISARSPGVMGRVVKVDGTNLVIATGRPGAADAKEVTVATDGNTKITINGKEGKLEDLKADMRVFVTPPTGTAKTISSGMTGGRRGGRAPGGAPGTN